MGVEAPLVVRQRFRDVDELVEVSRRWDVDFRQIGRGHFEGAVTQWLTPFVQVSRVGLSLPVDQRGSPPRGLHSFALPTRPSTSHYWRGHHVGGDDLLIFPPGGELECVSGPDFEMLIVSVGRTLLDAAAAVAGWSELERLIANREVVELPSGAAARLRREVARLIGEGVGAPAASVPALRREIPGAVVRALGAAREHRCGLWHAHVDLVRRGMELVREREQSTLSVAGLSRLLGTTERSLRRAFHDVIGMGPKSYIQAQGLTNVRRQLRAAHPDHTGVADVANEWGFWHMGQLAADYRRQFGELPSQTLRRRA